jgi:hypothetical protein
MGRRRVCEGVPSAYSLPCGGEYWDLAQGQHGTVEYDQDQHRQRIINWPNAAGGLRPRRHHKGHPAHVFDREYWCLSDSLASRLA